MKAPQHIGVIRLSAMGDVAMVVPVLRVLLQTYPNLKVTIISKGFFAPFFEKFPQINFIEARVYDEHKNLGLLRLAKEIKATGIDAFADLHNVIRSKIVTQYLSFQGLPTATIDKGRAEKRKLTKTDASKKIAPLKTTHQRYADVFEKLGLPIDLTTHKKPSPLSLSEKHHQLIGNLPLKIIGIAPFAAHESKKYPFAMMQEVVAKVSKTNSYKIFLFGGGDEESKTLDRLAQPYTNVINVASLLTFKEQLILISNLDGMLSMDSGNGHLAAMFGIPVITLWGVTHPYAGFVPFQQPNENQLISNRNQYPLIPTSVYGNTFPEGYQDCMKSIPVDLVVEKILHVF